MIPQLTIAFPAPTVSQVAPHQIQNSDPLPELKRRNSDPIARQIRSRRAPSARTILAPPPPLLHLRGDPSTSGLPIFSAGNLAWIDFTLFDLLDLLFLPLLAAGNQT